MATEVPSFAWGGGGLSELKRKATQDQGVKAPALSPSGQSFDDLIRGRRSLANTGSRVATDSIPVSTDGSFFGDDLGEVEDGWVVPLGPTRPYSATSVVDDLNLASELPPKRMGRMLLGGIVGVGLALLVGAGIFFGLVWSMSPVFDAPSWIPGWMLPE